LTIVNDLLLLVERDAIFSNALILILLSYSHGDTKEEVENSVRVNGIVPTSFCRVIMASNRAGIGPESNSSSPRTRLCTYTYRNMSGGMLKTSGFAQTILFTDSPETATLLDLLLPIVITVTPYPTSMRRGSNSKKHFGRAAKRGFD
jgi:hypothetical protein